MSRRGERSNRLRTEGTDHLVAAARVVGVRPRGPAGGLDPPPGALVARSGAAGLLGAAGVRPVSGVVSPVRAPGERIPWADQWQRVTHGLARAVAELAQRLDWTSVAAHFRLNWKTVEAAVESAVLWGLAHRRWRPLHVIGIDEVSRRKGHQYLTVVYDLRQDRVIWVGRDRTARTMERFFTWLGPRRARSIHPVCCDRWAVYLDAVRTRLPQASVVFDRFHLTRYLSRAVDDVRRLTWRRMHGRAKAEFKQTRLPWLRNPETLRREDRTRLSALLRLNSPIVKGYLLKEDLRRFWEYRSTAWAEAHLRQWLWRAAQPAGAVHEAGAHAADPPRGRPGVDQDPGDQWRPRGDEQQDQADQPPGLRLSHVLDLHRQHLPQLRRPPAPVTCMVRPRIRKGAGAIRGDAAIRLRAAPPRHSAGPL